MQGVAANLFPPVKPEGEKEATRIKLRDPVITFEDHMQ